MTQENNNCTKEKPVAFEAAGNSVTESESPDNINNIFDSVFRTVIEYFPQLIIPVINEIFKTHYPMDEGITVLKNEHVTWGGKTVTDLFFDLDGRCFHVECQSIPDGRMLIRVVEYAAAIAIEHAMEEEDGSFRIKFPSSCVIYLRAAKSTPDKLTMYVDFPECESVAFNVPVLKVNEYTKDELFRKELLMLLPYYLMRYEDECRDAGRFEKSEEADQQLERFLNEYEDVISRLSKVCMEKEQQYLFRTLADLIIAIATYLAPDNEKERVKTMGGHVIKTSAQIIMEEGLEQGKLETLVSLVQKGIITLKQAAEEYSLPVDSFLEQCKKQNLEI